MAKDKWINYFSRFTKTSKKKKQQQRKASSDHVLVATKAHCRQSLDWTKRPQVDRGQLNKHVLGPVTAKDRKAGSFLVHMMVAKREQQKKICFDKPQLNEDNNFCKRPLRKLPPLIHEADNSWERTCEMQTPSYFDIFRPIIETQKQTSVAVKKNVRFMDSEERKISTTQMLPLVIPEDAEQTPNRSSKFWQFLQTLFPCICRSNLQENEENEEYAPGSKIPCTKFSLRVISVVGWGGEGTTYLVQKRHTAFIAKLSYEPIAPPEIRHEFALMRSLQHPYIATVSSQIPRGYLMPVYKTDLFEYVRSGQISMQFCYYVARCMFSAVRYIHRLKIAHLDIKPQNILLSHQGEPKLSDFGAAESFYSEVGTKVFRYLQESKGSIPFLSPELLAGRRYNAMNLVDSWALGGTLYFAITNGVEPYGLSMYLDEMLRRITEGKLRKPRGFDDYIRKNAKFRNFISLLMQLMTVSPSHRLTVTEADELRW